MRKNKIGENIIKFLQKYKIIFNYYFLSITFLLLFTMILISLIGNNVLKHEANVLKKEFINKNKRWVLDLSQSIENYLENLDTLSIIDLIDKISKQDEIVYAYVVNSEGEVMAHTEKSEVLKKYKDGFVNKKYLNLFIKNLKKVWLKEGEYKGAPTLVLSKPIILQFAKNKTLQELEQGSYDSDEMTLEAIMNNEEVSSITNQKNQETQEKSEDQKFYIAGAFHTCFSMEKLESLARFSAKQVRIYYIIAYAVAALLGYFVGKYLEGSLFKVNSSLEAFNKGIKVEELNIQNRFDSFKKLFNNINQFIVQHKEKSEKMDGEINEFNQLYYQLISKLCDPLDAGVIITDNYLKVEYINSMALHLINKKELVSRNINDVLDQHLNIIDEINKLIHSNQNKIQHIERGDKIFYLIPLYLRSQLKRFILLISLKGKLNLEGNLINEGTIEKEDPQHDFKMEEDKKDKISSRLKNL